MLDSALENAPGLRDLIAEWREAQSVGNGGCARSGAAADRASCGAARKRSNRAAERRGCAPRILGQLWFENSLARQPQIDKAALRAAEGERVSQLEVTGQYNERRDGLGVEVADKAIATDGEVKTRQAYYPGYTAWEQRAGHHDQLSDIFVLGLILGALALRRDLASADNLQIFVHARSDLMREQSAPASGAFADRREDDGTRPAQAPAGFAPDRKALAHYREQDIAAPEREEEPLDLSDRGKVRKRLHEQLRDRLFEISRRNRLIYFHETGGTVNLTVGSMPNVIEYKTIKPAQLFYLNGRIDLKRPIDLNAWLQFQDYGLPRRQSRPHPARCAA